jgi:hypothetical protein
MQQDICKFPYTIVYNVSQFDTVTNVALTSLSVYLTILWFHSPLLQGVYADLVDTDKAPHSPQAGGWPAHHSPTFFFLFYVFCSPNADSLRIWLI